MKKWNLLDQANMPDGNTLSLHERDGRFTIRVAGIDLMSTHQHASEEKLAELACAHIRTKPGARVLIGGLGFGFTLRAAMAAVSKDASLVVAEIMPAIISWNINPAFDLSVDLLTDPRVETLQRDVADVLKEEPGGFDSIILDVDNGPAALSTAANGMLYRRSGLLLAKNALRPGGVVGYWSASADPAFARLMNNAGFDVEMQKCRAHATSGGWHTLFIGRVK